MINRLPLVPAVFFVFFPIYANAACGDMKDLTEALSMPYDKTAYVTNTIRKYEENHCKNLVKTFIDAINNRDSPYRLESIHALATIGGQEATTFLLKLWSLYNKSYSKSKTFYSKKKKLAILLHITGALHKTGNMTKTQILYIKISDTDKAVRYYAAKALGMVDTPESRSALWNVLRNDPMALPRCAALDSLVELKAPFVISYAQEQIKQGKEIECFFEYLPDSDTLCEPARND